jgi:hypothetical protein
MYKKIPFECVATIIDIGAVEDIKRPQAPRLKKRILKLQTIDDQIFYAEIRNSLLSSFDIQDIQIKDKVNILFCFQGSQKNGKRYNNIYIRKISRILNIY